MTQEQQPFEELYIPKKEVGDFSASRYRVYFDAKNYKLIEAVSAMDALMRRGVNHAYKIQKHDPMAANVLQLPQMAGLMGLGVAVEQAAPIVAMATPPVESEPEVHDYVEISAPIEPHKQEVHVGLSNEEVERLLNGN